VEPDTPGASAEETTLMSHIGGQGLRKREAHLVIVSGTNVGEMFAISAETTTIGRDPKALIRIDDSNVSRMHARIVRRGSAYWLEDLGSANGSLVNQQRIDSPQELHEGDKVSIGSSTVLRFSSYDELDETYQRRVRESILMDGFYRALFSGSPAPSFVVDVATDNILVANHAATQTYGYSETELASMRFSDLAASSTVPDGGGETVKPRRKDGALLEVELTTQVLALFNRPAKLTIAKDLTERRRIEARLRIADRMASIGILAAGIAHEINNPLAYVAANIQFAREALNADDPIAAALAEAADGSERIRRIVRSLRAFSVADDATREVVDIHGALDAAVAIAMNEIRHRARIVKRYTDAPLAVHGYSGRLGQVFLNLLVNAAQAIAEGDVAKNEIAIVTRVCGEHLVIEVHDTGSGIPPAAREQIFDTFFTTKTGGTGLGLSICHNIVSHHGGHIEFTSEIDKGTVFRVFLPRHAAEARPK
jgi:signal transduction histidine kinase